MRYPKSLIMIKRMIESNAVTRFSEIFDLVPKRRISEDANISMHRMELIEEKPDLISIREIHKLARTFEVSKDDIYKLVYAQLELNDKLKNKKTYGIG